MGVGGRILVPYGVITTRTPECLCTVQWVGVGVGGDGGGDHETRSFVAQD